MLGWSGRVSMKKFMRYNFFTKFFTNFFYQFFCFEKNYENFNFFLETDFPEKIHTNRSILWRRLSNRVNNRFISNVPMAKKNKNLIPKLRDKLLKNVLSEDKQEWKMASNSPRR